MNQYIGTLHTEIDAPEADSPELRFGFDDHYFAYFAKHASSWRLLLADPLLDKLRSSPSLDIAVDGRSAGQLSRGDLSGQPITIQIPAGTGTHTWKLTAARKVMPLFLVKHSGSCRSPSPVDATTWRCQAHKGLGRAISS